MTNSNDRQLKSLNVKNNCSPFDYNNNFIIDSKTKIKDDTCNENGEIKQNNNINDYMLSNYASCNCSLDNVLKTSTNNRGILIKDGYGVSECNISGDTNLRQGKVERHYKSDLQLFPRPYLTTPSNIKGELKTNLETKLIHNQLNIMRKGLTENYGFDDIVIPQIPHLAENIQNHRNIIPESSDCKFSRTGINSREIIKYHDYMNRSNDSDVIKNLLKKKMECLYN